MEIATTRLSSRGQIVIPIEMRKDLKEGDKLIIIKNGEDLIIKKSIPEILLASHKSLAKTWLTEEEDKAGKTSKRRHYCY
ncbi:MAG: AbrB/MazE/SpoVT family DNA-binding domain-containing protein [Nanoarchaeota archaeon]